MYSLQISMYEKIRKVSALNIAVAHVCKKIWNPQILRIYSFMLVRRMTWRKSKLASPWVWTSTSTNIDIHIKTTGGLTYGKITALCHASYKSKPKTIQKLVNATNIDLHFKDNHGYSAVHWAVVRTNCVQVLMGCPLIDWNIKANTSSKSNR